MLKFNHRFLLNLFFYAIKKAIEKHRRLGESISIWQDGQVVTLTAEQIPPLKLDD